jgi:uncharacterized protein (DUF305 family)
MPHSPLLATPAADAHDTGDTPTGHRPSRALLAAIVALVVAVGFGGWMLGTLSPRTGHPSELSADAGFARDMQTHHNQAVQLSLIVRDNSTNETVRSIAYDIATTQSQQSGQLFALLRTWGLPQTAERPDMAWMEDMVTEGTAHPEHDAGTDSAQEHAWDSMGMATPEQIGQLEAARGTEADRIFLTLMIRHHEGGVAMAEAALERAQNPIILDFAQKVVTAQTAEIRTLTTLLDSIS